LGGVRYVLLGKPELGLHESVEEVGVVRLELLWWNGNPWQRNLLSVLGDHHHHKEHVLLRGGGNVHGRLDWRKGKDGNHSGIRHSKLKRVLVHRNMGGGKANALQVGEGLLLGAVLQLLVGSVVIHHGSGME